MTPINVDLTSCDLNLLWAARWRCPWPHSSDKYGCEYATVRFRLAHDPSERHALALAIRRSVRHPLPMPPPLGHTTMLDALGTTTQTKNSEAPLKNIGDRQRLLERLNLALRIARRTIQYLGRTDFMGADLPEGNFLPEKPLAEAAMLLYAAKEERSHPGVKEVFDALVQDLMPYARSKQMGWDVLRYPSVCLQVATPHILLGLLGFEDSQFDGLLGRSAAASVPSGGCQRSSGDVALHHDTNPRTRSVGLDPPASANVRSDEICIGSRRR